MPSWYDLVAAEFAKIYDEIPQIDCKGLCGDVCGPIDMHPWERRQIRRAGVKLPPHRQQREEQRANGGHYTCPALSAEERCTVYDDRPTICRLWGVMDALRCPYGCTLRDGARRLTDLEAVALLDRSYKVGTGEQPHTVEYIQAKLKGRPDVAAVIDRLTAASKPTKTRKIPKE